MIALPVLDDLLPARLMPLAFLFASILLAIYTDGALRDTPRRALKLGATGVALAFLIPAVPFPSEAVTTPEFLTSAAVRTIPASSVALVLPFARAGDGTAHALASAERHAVPHAGVVHLRPHGADRAAPPPSVTMKTAAAIGKGSRCRSLRSWSRRCGQRSRAGA